MTAIGLTIPASAPARAQGLFGNWDAPQPKVRKKRARPESVATTETKKAVQKIAPTGPLVISVSLNAQKLRVFDGSAEIAESPISSGRVGYGTPTGIFTIVEKNRVHHSNLYGGAPMPNMQRITWSGVALHAGALPGYPASHGCIRLPHGFSRKLFDMTKMNTRVIVSREPVVPVSFSHDKLFAAYPPENELQVASAPSTKVADASNSAIGVVTEALVTTAAAAAPPEVTPAAQRPSYRERRLAEQERLTAAIRAAGFKKLEASVVLAQVTRETEKALAPYETARTEIDRLEGETRNAEAQRAAFESDIKRLDRQLTKPGKKSKLARKRDELAAKLPAIVAKAEQARSDLEARVEAVSSLKAAADEARRKRSEAAAALALATSELKAAEAAEESARKRDAKRAHPVSVFISRKTQRLYVRQGWAQILDVPVTFERPEEPVGTHVFTALNYTPTKTAMTWSVASVQTGGSKVEKKLKKGEKRKETEVALPVKASSPSEALDRISIPAEVREQIEDVMKPGSSLVVSDNGIGNETGEYTDFIIQTR